MQLNATDKRYVYFPVKGPPGWDPTAFPVAVAIVPEATGEPAANSSAWATATWSAGQQARLLVDASTFTPGAYMAWVRVTAAPEVPVMQSGRIRIGAVQ